MKEITYKTEYTLMESTLETELSVDLYYLGKITKINEQFFKIYDLVCLIKVKETAQELTYPLKNNNPKGSFFIIPIENYQKHFEHLINSKKFDNILLKKFKEKLSILNKDFLDNFKNNEA